MFDVLPWWVAALVAAAITAALLVFKGSIPPWAQPALSSLRGGALARLWRRAAGAKLTVVPQEPADENGPQPPGQPLDVDGEHPGGDTPGGA